MEDGYSPNHPYSFIANGGDTKNIAQSIKHT
jgi:hypothetical protein